METSYSNKYKKKKPKKKKKEKKISSLETVDLNSNEEGYDMVQEANIRKKKDKSSSEEALYRDIKKKPLVRLRSSEEDDYNDARKYADPTVINYVDVDPLPKKKKEKKKKTKKKGKAKAGATVYDQNDIILITAIIDDLFEHFNDREKHHEEKMKLKDYLKNELDPPLKDHEINALINRLVQFYEDDPDDPSTTYPMVRAWIEGVRSGSKKKKSKKKKSKKKKKKKINQSGGLAPCIPCMAPVLSGLGLLGAGTAAAGTAVAMSSKDSTKVINGKISRKKEFESDIKEGKKTKKKKYSISQKDKKVVYKEGKKTIKKKFKNIKQANKYYDMMVNKCKKKCKK